MVLQAGLWHEFETSLGELVRHCLKTGNKEYWDTAWWKTVCLACTGPELIYRVHSVCAGWGVADRQTHIQRDRDKRIQMP